jgi:hypothetical protein
MLVDRDELVESAFAASHGFLPHRVFSDAYRRFVENEQRRRRQGRQSAVG